MLLIEPDDATTAALAGSLLGIGYEVRSVATAMDARWLLTTWEPSAVISELDLPDQDGLVLIPWIAAQFDHVGILVCSERAQQRDVVSALKLGADDFVQKPIDMDELQARLERVIVRAESARVRGPVRALNMGRLIIRLPEMQVRVDGEPVHLTPSEYRLALKMAENVGKVVSWMDLHKAATRADADDEYMAKSVYMHVSRLRQKLTNAGLKHVILSERGAGYRMLRA